MLSELFHYFRKYNQEIAHKYGCAYLTIEFRGDLSGSLIGRDKQVYMDSITVFSFIDINDAIKKFRKEIDSWQS